MNSMNRIGEMLRNICKRRSVIIIALALLGALLIAISFVDTGADETGDTDDYKRALEEELADVCSQVEGAGKCRVIVSFAEGERTEYKGSQIVSVSPPRVRGVTVICDGAGSASVREDISDMIAALFDIGRNRICVLKSR